MKINSYIYSVLVVCSGDKGKLLIKNLLIELRNTFNITYASSANDARRLVGNTSFDFVIINSPLTDESGDELAKELSSKQDIMFLIKSELYDNKIMSLLEYNVFTVTKPINRIKFYESLNALQCVVNKKREANEEVVKLKDKLEELRFISKAKCLLIEKKHLTEEEAHRYIEKEAMDSRMKKKLVAMDIIRKTQ